MNVRIRRLHAEYERLKVMMDGYQYASIIETFGSPPEKYMVEYHVKGLTEVNGEMCEREVHRAEITLGPAYPKEMPRCVMLTPVFHPNIDHLAVCTEDIGSAGQTLDQIVVFIAELISFQAYNLQSPRNGDAARWTTENQSRIPIDNANLFPPAWLNGKSDIEIAQAANAELQRMMEPQSAPLLHASGQTLAIPVSVSLDPKVRCMNCGRSDALAGLASCSQNHLLCDDCRLPCSNCTATFCLLCTKRCWICRNLFCDDCCLNCNQCSQSICLADGQGCRTCRDWVCKQHLDSTEECSSCANVRTQAFDRLTEST